MQKSVYKIPKMDCPAEENLIRMKLEGVEGIGQLKFDLENRRLSVFHPGKYDEITRRLGRLNLGAGFESTETMEAPEGASESTKMQARLLWIVLLINFAFFCY